jgi:hypothetical protein
MPGRGLVAICDLRKERLSALQSRYPTVTLTDDFEAICAIHGSMPSLSPHRFRRFRLALAP